MTDSSSSPNMFLTKPKKRELVAWILVALQVFYMSTDNNSALHTPSDVAVEVDLQENNMMDSMTRKLSMNQRSNEYYEHKKKSKPGMPFYESPQIHSKEDGLVSRVWRSNGSPEINSDLKSGSCWCSADDWCMCTPSLAIDVILRSGEHHIWCVRREDTGLMALMGGFTEVGETSLESVHRELMEEMGIKLAVDPILFGVYNDPRRDTRRHTTSVVYIADVSDDVVPKAGDDATHVVRLPIAEVGQHDFFVDHKTIIHDYVTMVKRKTLSAGDLPPEPKSGVGRRRTL
eukprot:scaffold1338_cov272-Chaetoceros_neogracile.AAC.5